MDLAAFQEAMARERLRDPSIVAKRMIEAARLIPRTRTAMGERFEPAFRRHAQRYSPSGIRKHLEDAIAFLADLNDVPVARYERIVLEAQRPRRLFAIRAFAPSPLGGARFAVYVWWRPHAGARLRYWAIA